MTALPWHDQSRSPTKHEFNVLRRVQSDMAVRRTPHPTPTHLLWKQEAVEKANVVAVKSPEFYLLAVPLRARLVRWPRCCACCSNLGLASGRHEGAGRETSTPVDTRAGARCTDTSLHLGRRMPESCSDTGDRQRMSSFFSCSQLGEGNNERHLGPFRQARCPAGQVGFARILVPRLPHFAAPFRHLSPVDAACTKGLDAN